MDKKSPPSNKTSFLFGINAVFEALKKNNIEFLHVLERPSNPRIRSILSDAKKKNVAFSFEKKEFFKPYEKDAHQGILAKLKKNLFIFENFEEIKSFLEDKKEARVLALDKISDPHNLGAISRSAYFFGIDLILMEKKDSAPLSATVHKVSSGASLLMRYALVGSLRLSLQHLRELGFHIYFADANSNNSQDIDETRFEKPLCLILGSEAKGVRKNLISMEDTKIRIPGKTDFDSLNVSVAAGIIFHALNSKMPNK